MQSGNIGTTHISELPISNNVGIINEPIQQNMQPPNMQQPNMQPPNMQQNIKELPGQPANYNRELQNMDNSKQSVVMENNNTQNSYNELVGQIQQADKLGITQLPSRDIPNNTENIVMDQETQPNYIPEKEMEDYIQNYQTPDSVILETDKEMNNQDRLDRLYTSIQMPLLVSILYFLFNLPVIRKYMHKYIPNLFNSDGNPNITGYLVNSILFGILYYILNNSISTILNA